MEKKRGAEQVRIHGHDETTNHKWPPIIYYIHYLYLYSYYGVFNIALVDLHYSLQDILFCNPWVALAIFTVGIMIFYSIVKEPIEIKGLTSFQKGLGCALIGLLMTVIAWTFSALGVQEASNRLKSKQYEVIISTEDRVITGFSYLTRNEDSLYFYRVREGKPPEIFMLRADKVKEISYGDTLP